MAEITRVHGSAHGNVQHDTGVHDAGAGVDTTFLTNELLFFGILVDGGGAIDLRVEMDALEGVEAVLREIASKSTVVGYRVEDTSAGAISVMVEGVAWNADNGDGDGTDGALRLQTAIRALGTNVGANGINVDSTTVTDVGFKLAVA